ncbi:hypothetical protein, partial [Enterocloster lavalensis]|uniref:hypothetical protein n=1 Tax=Enterocloster lavalensis TaxID=460384 RepID=UPI0023F10DC3
TKGLQQFFYLQTVKDGIVSQISDLASGKLRIFSIDLCGGYAPDLCELRIRGGYNKKKYIIFCFYLLMW